MRQFKKKIISDWFIIIIGHRLLLELHRIVIQNESWRAKQKSQRITVLLPWSPQFPLWKPSPILIFLSVRQRFLIPIILIKISSGIKIIIIAINSIHFLKFIYSFFFHRVPSNLFQKLLLHILEKRKEFAWQLARLYISGRLLSLHRNWRRLAVYQWWDSKAWYFEY